MFCLGGKFCEYFYLKFKHQSNLLSRLGGLLVVHERMYLLRCSALVDMGIPFKFEFLYGSAGKGICHPA